MTNADVRDKRELLKLQGKIYNHVDVLSGSLRSEYIVHRIFVGAESIVMDLVARRFRFII
jgi:hypothetical protein